MPDFQAKPPTDLQLARLAMSQPRVEPLQPAPMLPVMASNDRDLGFVVEPGTPIWDCTFYAVRDGQRVAEIDVMPLDWMTC
jgi:hypothetical protein